MVTFKVDGHEYALKFTMRVLCELGDAIGEEIDLETLSDKLFVWLKNPQKLMKMAVLMARAGEAAEGRKFAHDYDWLVDNIPPSQFAELVQSIALAVRDGMTMETGKPGEDEEVDVVLEEIKKNKEPTE